MGVASFLGGFLLFAATILLLVATISSPVVNNISLLNVNLNGATSSRLTFGVFGYCRLGNPDQCSPSQLGYDIAGVISSQTGVAYSNNAIENLTKGLILHPIACGLAFIAFVIAIFSDRFGYLFASIIAFLAFIASLIALILDFIITTVVRNYVNSSSNGFARENVHSSFGVALWLTLAATIVLFFSSFVVCFGACSARRNKRRESITPGVGNNYGNSYGNEYAYGQPATGPYVHPKRKWYQRNRTGAGTY